MSTNIKQHGSILKIIIVIVLALAAAAAIYYFYTSSSYSAQTPRTVTTTDATWTIDIPGKLAQDSSPNDGVFTFTDMPITSSMIFLSTQSGNETIEKTLIPQLKSTKVTENTMSSTDQLKIGYKYGVDKYDEIIINGAKAVYTEKQITIQNVSGLYKEALLASVSLPCGTDGKRLCSVWAFTNDPAWQSPKESLLATAESIRLKP